MTGISSTDGRTISYNAELYFAPARIAAAQFSGHRLNVAMHEFYERSRRKGRKRGAFWGILGGVAAIGVGIAAYKLDPFSATYNGFELHGGPVVINSAVNPTVVALTSHWETHNMSTRNGSYENYNYGELHWDVFAFNAKDLTEKWTTRLATVRRGQRDLDARILGISHNTIWVVADGVMAVSLSDGEVTGDTASIAAANPQLGGVMPQSSQQYYFDDGLMLIAADGRRWRVDNESLRASPDTSTAPIKTSIRGIPVPRASDSLNVLPISLSTGFQAFKTRDFVVGDTWYGMMHPSEVELQRRDPHTQDFNAGLRFRLWSTPLRDTLDRMRNPAKLPLDFAPLPASPEFLNGGLLSVPDAAGRDRVVGIANPTRFLVLHQDRVDQAAQQSLSCITLEARVCWTAQLEMRIATGFSMLTKGSSEDWALVVVGEARPRAGDKLTDDAGDDLPLLARVRIEDGRVQLFRFADVDFAGLDATLTPFRHREVKAK